MSYPLPRGAEKLCDDLVAEHEAGEHLFDVYSCPRCEDEKPPRFQCQFCNAWDQPVPGRVPSLTCSNCWLEIQGELQKDNEQ